MTNVSYREYTGNAAENYERYFVPAIGGPVAEVTLAAANPQPGERVLDVACGTGIVARRAAERVGPSGRVTGIDLAPDMIDVARTAPAPAAPKIEWDNGDATSLPYPDDAFDVVLCQMGLMFIEDRGAAVSEMHRVLAAGGRAVVVTPGAIQPLFEVLEQGIVDHIGAELGVFVRAVFSMDDPAELATLLERAGFSAVTGSATPIDLELPAPRDFLWQYVNLTPMAPIAAAAPPEARDALERDVVESWAPFVSEGRLAGSQPVVVATGRRD